MKTTFFLRNILAGMALSLGCVTIMAQTAISDYRPGLTQEGAVYFLPKTVVRVSVMIEKTTYEPGDFARYAQRYLRLNNVETEPSVSYRVIGLKQWAEAVADTTKAYALKFNARTVAANVVLSDDGVLLAINAEARRQEPYVPFLAAPKAQAVNPRQYMNEEILAAGSTAKMAELTAREIYDLRENRNLLIKGQADFMPQDGAQMQLMLHQLEAQDRALTQLFQGITTRDTTEQVLTVVPDGPINHQVLFRLSQKRGLVDSDDLSGAPYYISIDDLNTVPPVDEEAAMRVKKKQYEAGVYVSVPGRMRSTLYDSAEPLQAVELPAPQFGNVELLSGELFNKRYTTHLWLHPLTGAVERLEAEQPK